MTELVPVGDNGHSHSTLTAWAEEMTAAAQIARGVAGTPFVPRSLRAVNDLQATTANVAAALLAGRELGLEPMAALRSIHVIDGTPALSALALRALVLAAGHELWVEESTKTRAIVRGRRNGSSIVQSSTWTIDRARDAGIAGKDNWRKQPTSMLVARATAECARLVAPEALLGLPYAAEEIGDDEGGAETAAAPERSVVARTARRRTIPPPPDAPAAAPSAVAPPPAQPDPEPESARATRGQVTAIHTAFAALGIKDRAHRLAETQKIIGGQHTIKSTNDLYPKEASTVLDELSQRQLRLQKADEEARAQADEDAQLEAAYWAETADQPALDDDPPLD